MEPQRDDLVISNRRATLEYDISVVCETSELTSSSREGALAEGRRLAQALGVDLWETEDQTHFILIASYRSGEKEPAVRGVRETPGPG
jgi:hypothetical protein